MRREECAARGQPRPAPPRSLAARRRAGAVASAGCRDRASPGRSHPTVASPWHLLPRAPRHCRAIVGRVYRTPLRDTRVAIIGLTGRVPSTSFVPGLPLVDAVELAAAWAAALAERLGIRLLVIKGDTLARHRLRDPRVPADVDLLVEPAAFERYCAAIVAAGWTERPVPRINLQAAHSVTYLHDGWPCDIDVHHRYPGFLADASTVFDELWRRRDAQPFAHVVTPTPDRVSSLVIMALHALRDGAASDLHRAELQRARSAALTPAERIELAELAQATGCAGTLHDLLAGLGVHLPVHETAELREWQARVASRSQGAYPWLL